MSESQNESTTRLAITVKNAVPRTMAVPEVTIDTKYDNLLTDFGKATLKERYLTEGETPQDRFANCVRYYANDGAHAQRMYNYIAKQWAIPATPILSNGGTTRGNLISCFLNSVNDNLEDIVGSWVENIWLAAKGGGLGIYYGNVRGIGEKVGSVGRTSGAMSFIKVNDALTNCISQGSLRRGNAAIFMDISHPEIETFIDMRLEMGGDPRLKAPNLHHGVNIPDAFYEAAINDDLWDLVSPHTGEVVESISARNLFQKILMARMAKGEPYILNIDVVNRAIPEHHKKSNLLVTASNLCMEIVLPTGTDHHGIDRTAVCCLFQTNFETFEEWQHDELFLKDIAYFLDNVLQDFIDNAGDKFTKARYSAMRERSVGVGTMGFHSFLQKKNIAFESAMAKAWNIKFFKHLREGLDKASYELAVERGACPDAAEHDIMERFSNKIALAPTASVSIIVGTSPGADPVSANFYIQKTLDGTFEVKNKHLVKILEELGLNTEAIWKSIIDHSGSVAHLDCLTDHQKNVYKTALEIDPRWYLDHAADRTPFVCQSQSLNIWVSPTINKYDLLQLHLSAWKKGIKSLYYLHSLSVQRADSTDGTQRKVMTFQSEEKIDYETCLSCQ